MRLILRILKFGFYTFVGVVILGLLTVYVGHKFIYPVPYSEVTTIDDIQEDGFCFGVNCQNAPGTAEDFIPVFAKQIKNYNKIAPELWPDNHLVNMSAVVQSIENNKIWFVSADGEVRSLTKRELKEICPVRPRYNIGFAPFENDTVKGVYLALSEDGLKNVLEYQKYQYLGTYDLLLTFNHEMFHMTEQDKNWAYPEKIENRSRNSRIEDTDSRIERMLIFRQILEAYTAETTEERDSMILQLLSNYQYYKENHNDDYKAAKYFDRIEGTAHYYEIASSLYSAYPEQVYSEETLTKALKVLAKSKHKKPYEAPGLDSESYFIGAWTGFLLDEIQVNNKQWKIEIIQNPDLTPLEILAQIYDGKSLPPPVKPSKELEDEVKKSIEEKNNQKVAPGIFRMLYQLIF